MLGKNSLKILSFVLNLPRAWCVSLCPLSWRAGLLSSSRLAYLLVKCEDAEMVGCLACWLMLLHVEYCKYAVISL